MELASYICRGKVGHHARARAAQRQPAVAASRFLRIAKQGAKHYHRNFGLPDQESFTAEDILMCAAELARRYSETEA